MRKRRERGRKRNYKDKEKLNILSKLMAVTHNRNEVYHGSPYGNVTYAW
jgi:hypothetical protein